MQKALEEQHSQQIQELEHQKEVLLARQQQEKENLVSKTASLERSSQPNQEAEQEKQKGKRKGKEQGQDKRDEKRKGKKRYHQFSKDTAKKASKNKKEVYNRKQAKPKCPALQVLFATPPSIDNEGEDEDGWLQTQYGQQTRSKRIWSAPMSLASYSATVICYVFCKCTFFFTSQQQQH